MMLIMIPAIPQITSQEWKRLIWKKKEPEIDDNNSADDNSNNIEDASDYEDEDDSDNDESSNNNEDQPRI